MDQLTTEIERDVKPLIKNLTAMTAEASRAVSLATLQVERADRLCQGAGVCVEGIK